MVANLLREVLGNPWRADHVHLPYHRRQQLLTPTVLGIAKRAYGERDFDALPILADALEDAGCDSEDLLRHLRGQERCWSCLGSGQHFTASGPCNETGWMLLRGPHVRGCWALDTILGMEETP